MLVGGPLETLTGPAPRAQRLAVRIELLNECGPHAAIGSRRIFRGVTLIFLNAPRTVEHPDVIVCFVDKYAANGTEDPIVLELRPRRIDFESRDPTGWLLRDQRPLNDNYAHRNSEWQKPQCAPDL